MGINGNGGGEYLTVGLTGTIGADGIYLVANSDAAAWIRDFADQVAGVDFQNGPDSIQLRDTSGVTVDTVGYGTFGASDVFAGEAQPAPAAGPGRSLTRDATASDTNDNSVDFAVNATPSPGSL